MLIIEYILKKKHSQELHLTGKMLFLWDIYVTDVKSFNYNYASEKGLEFLNEQPQKL